MYLPKRIPYPDNTRAGRGEGEAKKPIKVWMSPEMDKLVNAWSEELNCAPGVIARWLLSLGAERLKEEMEREIGASMAAQTLAPSATRTLAS
ncbi:hypothetical protein SEA_DUMPTRUCK_90 [Gordonia phage DumpTruck]|nr:hypothetical protein SEA_DUMPTRUCK_90 [Gordonia phage DumpTruck]